MIFRSTTPAGQENVRQLLRAVFNANDDAPFLNNRHLQWKYYVERKDWEGSRSFALSEGERLLAHACAWPVTVLLSGGMITGFHPIDWAARPGVPGAGALLLREMRKLSDVSLSIGGTAAARKVIANTGYRPSGEMTYYARPLRPWLQASTHQRRNWKLPARLARNWWWNLTLPAAVFPGWNAERVRPEQLPPEALPVPSEQMTPCLRSTELFRYFEQCPIARHELYLAKERGELKGYFLLSFVPGQARVADAWVKRGGIHEWEALYRLAIGIALDTSEVAEITAASALETGQSALERCGFHSYQTLPVMLFDPKKLLAAAPPVHLQMIDNDFSFLHQGTAEYAT